MDGENNGRPYEQMDDLGGKPLFFGNTHIGDEILFIYTRFIIAMKGIPTKKKQPVFFGMLAKGFDHCSSDTKS